MLEKIKLGKLGKFKKPGRPRIRFGMNIQTKLISGFLVVVVLLIGMFGLGYYSLYKSKALEDQVVKAQTVNNDWTTLKSDIIKTVTNYQQYFLTNNDNNLIAARERQETVKTEIAALQGLISDDQSHTLSVISNNVEDMNSSLALLSTSYKSNGSNYAALLTHTNKINSSLENIVASVDKIIQDAETYTQSLINESNKLHNTLLIIMIGVASIAVIAAVLLSLIISRSISMGIKKISLALKKMATGDLTENVKIKSSDEIGVMCGAYGEMQKYLSDLVYNLKQNAQFLSKASEDMAIAAKQSGESTQQVAVSSQQMAKGAQEQSVNAQESAKSIEQLSRSINQLAAGAKIQSESVQKAVTSITGVSANIAQISENANQAAEASKHTAEAAALGADKSKQSLSGMEKIKSVSVETAKKIEELGVRSGEIGKIVAVIDDIASQTNLLALNAAIEAARAGEQGRGFAVVSDEVRKLAERTTAATKEIAELISSVQKGVKEANKVIEIGSNAVAKGYEMAIQAGEGLEQIIKASAEVNTRVEQISIKTSEVNQSANELVKVIDKVGSITEQNTASSEQMIESAAQVSKLVETVAGIAEENSASTEEVSASSEEMSAQVQEIVASSQTLKQMALSLEQSVAMFKVSEKNAAAGQNPLPSAVKKK
jgi:methyl-accepting chemotaxis protein